MKKTAKRIIIVGVAVILIGALAVAGYSFVVRQSNTAVKVQYDAMGTIDLSQISDGVYRGYAGKWMVQVTLDVTVSGHQITDIEIVKQVSGGNYKALDTVPRILEAQTANVDAVTGATSTSKAIMAAVYNALRDQAQ